MATNRKNGGKSGPRKPRVAARREAPQAEADAAPEGPVATAVAPAEALTSGSEGATPAELTLPPAIDAIAETPAAPDAGASLAEPAALPAEPVLILAEPEVTPPEPAIIPPEPVVVLPQPVVILAEPVVAPARSVAVAEPRREVTLRLKRTPRAEPTDWPRKAFDAWSENAAAFCDFARALAEARSPADVVTLQSRFMNERYDAILRQSNDFAELARTLALETAKPFPPAFRSPFAA